MIKETLEATRAQLVAALAVVDLALAEIERVEREEQERRAAEPEPCRHENKKDVATMTNPGAWYCPGCQQSGTN